MTTLNGFNATPESRLNVSAGGLIIGPGTETSDEIPCVSFSGVAILNAETVRIIGRERLDALVSLATTVCRHLWLSPGEYVVPAAAAAVLGRKFIHSINDAGNIIRDGCSPDPDEHRGLVVEEVEAAIRILTELNAKPDCNDLSPEARAAVDAGTHEDSRSVHRSESYMCFGLGGNLGIALGAATDEMDRQRGIDLRADAGARADRHLGLLKQVADDTSALAQTKIQAAQKAQGDDDAVRQHIQSWTAGRQSIRNGDFTPFEDGLRAYNQQQAPFDDGNTIVPQSTPEGTVLNHLAPDGTLIGSSKALTRGDVLTLFDHGMAEQLKFISPARYDAALKQSSAAALKAEDRASRERVAGTQADAKMYGADTRADAQTESAQIRAGGATEAARIRATTPRAGGGLTASQERTNSEIDAARAATAGLDPEDIKARTARTSNTGRENPNFDPGLARQAALANRRKVGKDDSFDTGQVFVGKPLADMSDDQLQRFSRVAGAGGQQKIDSELLRRAFTADPAMAGKKLGSVDPKNGLPQVLDSSGKVLGHYRR